MNTAQIDGRRLCPRFQIDEVEEILRYSTPTNPAAKAPAKLVEVAKDSMTCKLALDVAIPIGTKITIELLQNGAKKILDGKVASSTKRHGFTRLGILFSQANLLPFFPSANVHPSPNQRKTIRRNGNSAETGKREFDRRGFWPGLLSKRFFSHRVYEEKPRGFYFYMTPLQSATSAHVIVDGRDMIMMSSNNYLGLSVHPKVKEAAIEAIKKYGSAPSASSLLGGTLDIHLQLEEELAKFKQTEAACIFSSGYVTNVTTLTTVLSKNEAVFNDEKNHASLIDGSRFSGALFRAYRHKNVQDLDRKLSGCEEAHKLVVSDTVFSMDGDIAPLPEIYRLCKKHRAALMVDEAHATGVFGNRGRGLLEHFGLEGKPEIVMGTLSKSLSGIGGYICGSRELVQILKHTARAFVFSAYVPPCICAAVIACLKLIDEEPERRKRLWRNADHMRSGLENLGFNVGESQSPIIPVIFPTERETNLMTKGLREAGIYVSPAIYPAVKKNATRVRTTIMATHSDQDIEKALSAFKQVRNAVH